jgi:hypothetical protein
MHYMADEDPVTLKVWLMGCADPLTFEMTELDAARVTNPLRGDLERRDPGELAGYIRPDGRIIIRIAAIAAVDVVPRGPS